MSRWVFRLQPRYEWAGIQVSSQPYQPGLPQYPELMGDGGGTHGKKFSNLAHPQLRDRQGTENTDAGKIAEDVKEIGQFGEGFLRRHGRGQEINRTGGFSFRSLRDHNEPPL